jgi:hypothetical protein
MDPITGEFLVDDKIGEYQDHQKMKTEADFKSYTELYKNVESYGLTGTIPVGGLTGPVFRWRWMPHTIYKLGEVVLDFFNRMQSCNQYGVSGMYEPMWHNNYGSITHDGGINWIDYGLPVTFQQPIINIPPNLSFKKEEESQPMTDFIEEREV